MLEKFVFVANSGKYRNNTKAYLVRVEFLMEGNRYSFFKLCWCLWNGLKLTCRECASQFDAVEALYLPQGYLI